MHHLVIILHSNQPNQLNFLFVAPKPQDIIKFFKSAPVVYSYIAREYVNSRWVNVKCLYIENQAFCWKGLIELTQFTQNEPTTW